MDVNGITLDNRRYARYHAQRFDATIRLLKEAGARHIIEVGAHPWALTARLVDEPDLQVAATVSTEETSLWPDDIDVTERPVRMVTDRRAVAQFVNYSANVEYLNLLCAMPLAYESSPDRECIRKDSGSK